MTGRIWKALIVDDERLARKKLRLMLAGFSNVEIVGEADSVAAAVEAVEKTNPEIIFLDIQMPGASGFDLLGKIQSNAKIIFVTAYDEYAIRAFEVNALDYLLKPVKAERLALAIERLSAPEENKILPNPLGYDDFLFLNTGWRAKFVKVASIKCILAADVYSEVQVETKEKFLVLKPLGEWEQKLPAKNFKRIHRSTIINLEFIERTEKWLYSYRIYLREIAEPFVVSRRYAAKLKNDFD